MADSCEKSLRGAKVCGLFFFILLFGCWLAAQANSYHVDVYGAMSSVLRLLFFPFFFSFFFSFLDMVEIGTVQWKVTSLLLREDRENYGQDTCDIRGKQRHLDPEINLLTIAQAKIRRNRIFIGFDAKTTATRINIIGYFWNRCRIGACRVCAMLCHRNLGKTCKHAFEFASIFALLTEFSFSCKTPSVSRAQNVSKESYYLLHFTRGNIK